MNEIKDITAALVNFRNERDWEQFHNSKDLALAISIEAAELNELFLWKKSEEVKLSSHTTRYAFIIILCILRPLG